MQARPFTILLLLASAPPLSGDVTIRFHNQIEFGAVIPAPVAEGTRNGTESALPESTAGRFAACFAPCGRSEP